jgi:lipopolysaccharide transport system ATP-binding protein
MIGDADLYNVKVFEKPLGNDALQVERLSVFAKDKKIEEPIIEGESVIVQLDYHYAPKQGDYHHIAFAMKDDDGKKIFTFSNNRDQVFLQPGKNRLICEFPRQFLNVGQYFIDVLLVENRKRVFAIEEDAVSFMITMKPVELGVWMGKEPGFIKPSFDWRIEAL